jgi:RHS repeat-associated protein
LDIYTSASRGFVVYTNANSTPLDLLALMTSMLLSPGNGAAGKGMIASELNTINSGLIPADFFRGNNSEESTTVPKAYINYIFLDEQFKYAGCGASRVGESGIVKDHWQADPQLRNITVPKNGYIFVYVSNESNFNVFFDNLQVIHKPGPILEETHYFHFGLTMAGISSKAAGKAEKRFKYNGKELQHDEFNDGSGLELYDYGARMQDPQLGRCWVVDPKAANAPGWSPYNAMWNNPILNIDPDGAWAMPPDEFDKNGNKISDLGGSKIDFYHQENGDTKIVDRASGASNTITGGEELIRGYTQRPEDISWARITFEWNQGVGPAKSMIADFDNSTKGAFESLGSFLSTYSTKARKDVLNSGLSKNKVSFDYSEVNPFTAKDMWEQMWGRTNVNWYKLGDKTLFMMTDSKSWKSFSYRAGGSWERESFKLNGNTYQTYIWFENNSDIQMKVNQNTTHYNEQFEKVLRESQHPTGPKW